MKTVTSFLAIGLLLPLFASPVWGEVRTESVSYQDGDVMLKGFFAWDDAIEGQRPGVIVVHEWWGLNDYAKKRAEMLAALGYVAFALDMYGDGRVTEHAKEAGAWSKQISANVGDWTRRATLGLEILRGHKLVDKQKVAAIGYCFGGSTVMQLAYSGADVNGVVSFHGSLPVPGEEQMDRIKSKILIAHGNEDAFVPEERIKELQAALDKANADWQMVIYGGARHSFTNPQAAGYGIDNVQYNREADTRSWQQMQLFFDEIFSAAP